MSVTFSSRSIWGLELERDRVIDLPEWTISLFEEKEAVITGGRVRIGKWRERSDRPAKRGLATRGRERSDDRASI